jgi:hypothetical protein
VRCPLRDELGLAGAESVLLVLESDAELPLEDVEDLIFGPMKMERG